MAAGEVDATPSERPRWHRVAGDVVALLAVALGALIVGGVTSPAQGFLPDALTSFANSPSGWTMLAFLLVWSSRLRPLWAAFAGIVAFVLMVEGYRIVSEWRGLGYGAPFQDMFTYLGVVVGPLVGAGAALLRYGRPVWRLLSIGPLVVIMIGDGIYGLTVVSDTTSPVYWWAIIIAGVGVCAAHVVMQRPGTRRVLLFAGLTAVFTAAYVGAMVFVNVWSRMGLQSWPSA